MWEFFIKNNRFAYLFLVALIGVGSYSLIAIPKESAPEVVIPVGVVSTFLPGAPAADVESLITNEIERGLASLENVKEIMSEHIDQDMVMEKLGELIQNGDYRAIEMFMKYVHGTPKQIMDITTKGDVDINFTLSNLIKFKEDE